MVLFAFMVHALTSVVDFNLFLSPSTYFRASISYAHVCTTAQSASESGGSFPDYSPNVFCFAPKFANLLVTLTTDPCGGWI